MVVEHDVIGGQVVSPALVGRERELSQLLSAVRSPPALAVIEGEAGIGKTRLVAELRNQLGGTGSWFVTGGCSRIREPFPLGPVLEVTRQLGDQLASATLSPVVGALRPILPEVADVLPPQPPSLDDRMAERHRVFRGLAEVLGSLEPVVVVLEDLHWADELTIDFVSYLLADPPPKLSLVVTFRGEEVPGPAQILGARLSPSVSRANIAVPLLSLPQTGALAAAILGTDLVSSEFAAHLHERTSGLPFAIEELLALMRTQGKLRHRKNGWTRRTLEQLDVPIGIRNSVLERLRHLPGDCKSVLEAAAVLQSPMPVSVLTDTCGVPEAQAVPALEELLEAGLLTEDGERIGFRHLLAAQAVYGAMPGTRRRELHRRAARRLESVQPTPLGQLAHHLRHAGQLTEWVAAAEDAADQALELGHCDETVRLLREVLRDATLGTERRGRIAVKLARAAGETLHIRDVLDLLLDVPTDELPQPVRSELRFWLALLLHQVGGDALRARQLLLEAVTGLDGRPDLKAWAMVGLGVPTGAPGVPPSEHLEWLHRSLEILPDLTDEAMEVLVLGKVAMVLTSVGDPTWRRLADRVQELTGGEPCRRREVNAYLSVGVDACYVGHHEAAGELLRAGLAGARTCESRQLELRLRAGLALLDYCRGSWNGLRERADLLIEELADETLFRINVEVVAGCLALACGELEDAQQRLDEVVRSAGRTDGIDLLPIPVTAKVRLALALGEVDVAIADGQRLLAAAEAKGIWAPAARVLPPLAQALVRAGNREGAEVLVNHLTDNVHGLDVPLAPASVLHAQGLLASGARRWQTATDLFLEAAERYEAMFCPYEAAQAQEEAAATLSAAGDTRAEPTLRAALDAYQHLGAVWDAARAARIARRNEIPLPAAHRGGRRGYGNRLSPREREIAQLAAEGMTNKEIASAMFLSPKTVDRHVGAALRKLGVHTRRSLAERLGP